MSETSDRQSTHEATREQARERAREQARTQTRERAAAADLRRRRALVFGEVLPQSSRDDLPEQPDPSRSSEADEWLRSQVPPHHG